MEKSGFTVWLLIHDEWLPKRLISSVSDRGGTMAERLVIYWFTTFTNCEPTEYTYRAAHSFPLGCAWRTAISKAANCRRRNGTATYYRKMSTLRLPSVLALDECIVELALTILKLASSSNQTRDSRSGHPIGHSSSTRFDTGLCRCRISTMLRMHKYTITYHVARSWVPELLLSVYNGWQCERMVV